MVLGMKDGGQNPLYRQLWEQGHLNTQLFSFTHTFSFPQERLDAFLTR